MNKITISYKSTSLLIEELKKQEKLYYNLLKNLNNHLMCIYNLLMYNNQEFEL